jgi:hypothetical protein
MKKDNFFPMISLEIGTKIAFTSTDIFPATMHYKNTKDNCTYIQRITSH